MISQSMKGASQKSPERVINSALWAALGDAVGWIVEMAADASQVRRRIGSDYVSYPVPWRKPVGGWGGPEIHFPAGVYSDDTQLRLAVSRSIRGDGTFDPEAFAKIELPVWLSYSLGAGLGSKAAAANLSKKSANWFSNFYAQKSQVYTNGGGNGAAMRVQPHIWSARPSSVHNALLDVLRDSLITHGHPHGFCGAYFHALSLWDALDKGYAPSVDAWARYAEAFLDIPRMVADDRQLRTFWLEPWQKQTGKSLKEAVYQTRNDALRDLDAMVPYLDGGASSYSRVLSILKCYDRKFRGSGLKTAMAASVLAWIHKSEHIEDALLQAANEIGSDTDTIATMAGAILGVNAPSPKWPVQDREYLIDEATRLNHIRNGHLSDSFNYPDLITWKPPQKQSSSVGKYRDGLAVMGLGAATPVSEAFGSGEDVWQWMRLDYGQTVLIKRKATVRTVLKESQLPSSGLSASSSAARSVEVPSHSRVEKMLQSSLELEEVAEHPKQASSRESKSSIDELTDRVIKADFDDRILGAAFNECFDNFGSIESVVGFAAIISKAKLARKKRGR